MPDSTFRKPFCSSPMKISSSPLLQRRDDLVSNPAGSADQFHVGDLRHDRVALGEHRAALGLLSRLLGERADVAFRARLPRTDFTTLLACP